MKPNVKATHSDMNHIVNSEEGKMVTLLIPEGTTHIYSEQGESLKATDGKIQVKAHRVSHFVKQGFRIEEPAGEVISEGLISEGDGVVEAIDSEETLDIEE